MLLELERRRRWHPTPVLLPGESMVGGAWWAAIRGVTTSRTCEQLHFHFSLSHIGEGNGNPLQCSCLENPRDGGAWWAAVYGVAQSRTRLKRFSSSSSGRDRKGFPFSLAGKEFTCNAVDLGWDPWVGKIPWRRKDYPFQYSGLENSMDCIVQITWHHVKEFAFHSKPHC